jgi:hypothetical protein
MRAKENRTTKIQTTHCAKKEAGEMVTLDNGATMRKQIMTQR